MAWSRLSRVLKVATPEGRLCGAARRLEGGGCSSSIALGAGEGRVGEGVGRVELELGGMEFEGYATPTVVLPAATTQVLAAVDKAMARSLAGPKEH